MAEKKSNFSLSLTFSPILNRNRRLSFDNEVEIDEFDVSRSNLNSTKKDLFSKLIAGKRANSQCKSQIKKFQDQLNELTINAEKTMRTLESNNEKLQNENDQLTDLNRSMPQIGFLESQLMLLQNIKETATFDVISDEPFHEIGILQDGDDMSNLERRISALMYKLNKERNPCSKYISLRKENLKRRYLYTYEIVESSIRKTEEERSRLEQEVELLRSQIAKLKK